MTKFLSSLVCIVCIFIFFANAQNKDSISKIVKKDTLWRKAFQTGLNVNQGSYSNNWKGGGVNSFALSVFFKGRAYFENKKSSWDNNIDLEYRDVNTSGIGNQKEMIVYL